MTPNTYRPGSLDHSFGIRDQSTDSAKSYRRRLFRNRISRHPKTLSPLLLLNSGLTTSDVIAKSENSQQMPPDLPDLLDTLAAQLSEPYASDPNQKDRLLSAALSLLRAPGDGTALMHTLLPDGYEILAQTASPFASQIFRIPPPPLLGESSVSQKQSQAGSSPSDMAMKRDYVPKSLRRLAKKKTTKVHETLLWEHQGAVGKM
jgi:hypothetical protein